MLTIAAIVAIVAVVNAVLPSVGRTSGALISASSVVEDRIASQIEIVHATGQDGNPDATVWVKNIGASTVDPIEPRRRVLRARRRLPAHPAGRRRLRRAVLGVHARERHERRGSRRRRCRSRSTTAANLATGTTYYVKVVTPNGIADSKFFTV